MSFDSKILEILHLRTKSHYYLNYLIYLQICRRFQRVSDQFRRIFGVYDIIF